MKNAFMIVTLAIAVGLAVAVAPFASTRPDGLEAVAGEQNFLVDGRQHELQHSSPLPDYAFPGIDNDRAASGLAGFVGTLGVFAVGFGLAAGTRRWVRPHSP